MRILIIGPGKLKYMPYLHFYLDNMDWNANEIHVAYWNRDEKPEVISSYNGLTLHEFKCFMVNDAPLKEKFKKFKKFRSFCIEKLKKDSFDKLIVLHTLSGLMLYDYLIGRYKNKYILDYRDSTYESKSFFRFLVGKLVKCSYYTFVSSDAFRKFLPDSEKSKTYTSHNLLEDSLSHRDYEKIPSDRIRVAFWGFIRYVDINSALIDRIAADDRFELHYYGREQKDAIELKQYVKDHNYKNVYFHGEYCPEDRYEFVKNTDILDNIYLNPNTLLAMGNKYYDGIIFRIPQVGYDGAFMTKMSTEHGVGVALDPWDKNFCSKLYDYYTSMDKEQFNKNCDKELGRVYKEYCSGKAIIREFTNS
jgi:hypothetical protein